MAAPTSTNEVTARKLSSSISALWTKIKSTFQPVADRVTSIRAASSAADTKYPSEKAVAAALESKAPSAVTSEVTIANGDKMIIADASDSSKLKRASAAFDGSTTKKFLNQKGTFTQVLEADLEWGGDFRNSKSPSEAYTRQNLWFCPKSSAVSIEYCTDRTSDNPTWLLYGETETDRLKLFSGGEETAAAFYCGKNTHVHPGYTGSISGTKDLTDDIVPDQGLRITICCRSLSSRDADVDNWSYGQIVRILMNISTNSATGGPRHCKVETMTGANFKAGNDTWTDRGDYNLSGDSGWNSIPLQITFGGGWTQTSQIWVVRFTIWAEALRADPVSSQTGNLKINTIAALTKTTWTNDAMKRYGTPYSITETGGAVFKDIKFTSRKLKTNLARTSDSTFDGSADQTNIPVTGTLPVGNGGTGRTSVTSGSYVVGAGASAMVEKTPKEVGSNVLSSLDDKSNASSYANFVDGDFIVGSDHVNASTISASTFVRRTALNLWNYIKSKLTGSDVDIGGNAATATKATQDSDGSAINTTYKKLAESSKFTEPQWIDNKTRTSYNDLRIGNSFKLLSLGISSAGNLIMKELADGRPNSPAQDKSIIYTSNGGTLYNFNGNAATASALADETGFVHTTGNETVGGKKTFTDAEVNSESSAGTYSGFFVKRTAVDDGNKVYRVSLEVSDEGSRGIYDYGGSGLNGENKWILRKLPDGSIAIGESTNINKISIGGITLDFSGSLGNAANTLYFGWAGGGSS